ncbi:MAG: hypothetical protein KC496_10675, partial [Anaerolineae bacterium]|nr:hypothetical protein [Anaerolineae bacterium]
CGILAPNITYAIFITHNYTRGTAVMGAVDMGNAHMSKVLSNTHSNLNGKNLRAISEEHCKNLEITTLTAARNKIAHISPKIRDMRQLAFIDLRDNKLDKLPIQLAELPRLRTLLVTRGNPLRGIPADVREAGDDAILWWLQQQI